MKVLTSPSTTTCPKKKKKRKRSWFYLVCLLCYPCRFFVLNNDAGLLEYFVNEQSRHLKPRGTLQLAGAVISPSDEDSHTFTVNAASGEQYKLRGRTWILGQRILPLEDSPGSHLGLLGWAWLQGQSREPGWQSAAMKIMCKTSIALFSWKRSVLMDSSVMFGFDYLQKTVNFVCVEWGLIFMYGVLKLYWFKVF